MIGVRAVGRLGTLSHNSVYAFTRVEVEQHKPTPIQKRVQEEGIMAKVRLEKQYQLINSTPNDSLIHINRRFIDLKEKVNDPTFFMPYKKEYLLKLDQAYDQIVKVHPEGIPAELGHYGPKTKRDIIQAELSKIRKAKRIELVQTYDMGCLLLLAVFVAMAGLEEWEGRGEQRLPVGECFTLMRALSAVYEEWVGARLDKLRQKLKQRYKKQAKAEMI